MYVPPDKSLVHENTTCRQMSVMQELESILLTHISNDIEFILCGGFNARTSDARDFVEFGNNAPYMQDFKELPGEDIGIERKSLNKTRFINKFGK